LGRQQQSRRTTYVVQISTETTFDLLTSSVSTLSTSWIFGGLPTGTTFYAHVQAVSFGGTPTSWTDLGSTTTLSNLPTAAPFTSISPSQIQANWDANGNTQGTLYTAILSTAPSPSTNNLPGNKTVSNTTNLFAIFPSLNPNTFYYVDANANGGTFVSIGSTPTWANAPLIGTPPVVLSTQITANWSANNNPAPATSYRADISQDAGFVSYTPFTTTNLSFTFPNLTPNTTYYLRVSAINQAGVTTPPPTLLSTTRTLPGVPGSLPFTNISPSQIQANWSAPSNGADNSYRAILSSGPNPSSNGFANNQSTVTTNTSYVFPGLSPNVLYFVDVQAINNQAPPPLCPSVPPPPGPMPP